MADPVRFAALQHSMRRIHPLTPVVRRTLARLDRAPAAEIRRFQEHRLRMLVRLAAARSPFYRAWFRRSGLDPREIRTLEDLHLLPLVDRRVLADRPDDFLVYPRRLMWQARSSGTTGTPVRVHRTPGSSVYEMAALERQWSWFGVPRNPRRAVLRGSTFAATDRSVVRPTGDGRLLVSSYHLTPESLPEILGALRAHDPQVVEGWPSSISLLATLLRDAGERLPVLAVVTSSEVTSPAQRAAMSEVFEGPVVDHYGQTERVAMAGNCEAGSYHVFADYGIVELLPVAGNPARREIVGTALHNWGAPLLRYRTGDQVGPDPAAPCACGRAHPVLDVVDGRTEESFTAADGRHIPLPSAIIDDLDGLREAQVRQRAPGRFDVLLVPGAGYDDTVVRSRLSRAAESVFGPGQSVRIELVSRLPRTTAGKVHAAVVVNDLVVPRSVDSRPGAVTRPPEVPT